MDAQRIVTFTMMAVASLIGRHLHMESIRCSASLAGRSSFADSKVAPLSMVQVVHESCTHFQGLSSLSLF